LVSDVKDRTGWDLRVSAELSEIPKPSQSELTALRRLLQTMPASKAGDPPGPLPDKPLGGPQPVEPARAPIPAPPTKEAAR